MKAWQFLVLVEDSVKDSIKKHYKVEDKDFEFADPKHVIKTIAKTDKGYVGFSHRAALEFKIGDMLFDPKWDDNGKLSERDLESIPYKKRGSIKIKTMEQAREAAINFAKEVS